LQKNFLFLACFSLPQHMPSNSACLLTSAGQYKTMQIKIINVKTGRYAAL
jgi:hypothetical protein